MSEIKKINVNGTKYDIAGGEVVANPELEGTEPNLTGIEVDGAKYKVPQSGGGDTPDIIIEIGDYTDISYSNDSGSTYNIITDYTWPELVTKAEQGLLNVLIHAKFNYGDNIDVYYKPTSTWYNNGGESINFIASGIETRVFLLYEDNHYFLSFSVGLQY